MCDVAKGYAICKDCKCIGEEERKKGEPSIKCLRVHLIILQAFVHFTHLIVIPYF